MESSSEILFALLHDEWRVAQRRTDGAWADVWHWVRCYEAGLGESPKENQIARAARLEREAREWLIALRRHVDWERQRISIL